MNIKEKLQNLKKRLFKKKLTIRIYLKSGVVVPLRVYDFTARKNGMNDLVGIDYDLVKKGGLLYTRLDDISMITVDR